MEAQKVVLNANQTKALKAIVAAGKTDCTVFDGRAIRALSTRGLVKVTENKKGTFVAPTAKGKKILN